MTTLKIFKETNLYAAADIISFVNTNGEDITAKFDALNASEKDEAVVTGFSKSGAELEISIAEQGCEAPESGEPEAIEIYWDDLTAEKQAEIIVACGNNCNFDCFPIAEVSFYKEDDIDG